MADHAGRSVFAAPFPDARGNRQPGLVLTAYVAGTNTLATLYADRDKTPGDNPFTTDSLGNAWPMADPGDYELTVGDSPERLPFTVINDPGDLEQAVLDLLDHLSDATDAHDASAVSVAPVGNVVATDVQAAVAELDAQDTTEATTRAAADTGLAGSIATETAAREAADTALSDDLADEAATRLAADSGEAATRAAADAALAGDLADETAAREAADAALGSGWAADLADEVAAREAADSAEATQRENADTNLGADIDTERAARIAADDDEATARILADSSEAATRAAADTAETNARVAADGQLADLLNDEVADRAAADATETAARIAADNAHLGDSVDAHDASAVSFLPTGSVAATNVQDAVAEVASEAAAGLGGHTGDTEEAHQASAVTFMPAGSVNSTNVQDAIAEVASEGTAALAAHLNDGVGAHDASAVSVLPGGNLAATDVQAALLELDGQDTTNAGAVTAHTGDSVDAHDASAVSVVPTGGLAATDVQGALAELDAQAAAEEASRIAADTVLGDQITDEVADRAAADAVLATDVGQLDTDLAAEVTNRTNADALKVDKATLDANSVLVAVADDTPVALAVPPSTVVGRSATGDVTTLDGAGIVALVPPGTYVDTTTAQRVAGAKTGLSDWTFKSGRPWADPRAHVPSGVAFDIGDGASHPLSGFFGSLGAAQAVYPHAVALGDEFAWAAWQAAVNTDRWLRTDDGIFVVNRTIAKLNNAAAGVNTPGLIVECAGQERTLFDNRVANGPLFDLDIVTPWSYAHGAHLEDFAIMTTLVGGARPAASSGIRLRGQWNAGFGGVRIEGLTGDAVIVRNQLTDSDSSTSVLFEQVQAKSCDGIGVNFTDPDAGEGVTSGSFRFHDVTVIDNDGGGYRLAGVNHAIDHGAVAYNRNYGVKVVNIGDSVAQDIALRHVEMDGNENANVSIEAVSRMTIDHCRHVIQAHQNLPAGTHPAICVKVGITGGVGSGGTAGNTYGVKVVNNGTRIDGGASTFVQVEDNAVDTRIEDPNHAVLTGMTTLVDAGYRTTMREGAYEYLIADKIITTTIGTTPYTYTPRLAPGVGGRIHRLITTVACDLTIAPVPAGELLEGRRLTFMIYSGAAITVTFDAGYSHSGFTVPAVGMYKTGTFWFDPSSLKWRLDGAWSPDIAI